MKFEVVKTKAQLEIALSRIEELMLADPSPTSIEGKELELLAVLVESFESKNYEFKKPDPVDAVLYRMHEQDLKQADLVRYLGSRSRVSEFLARRRPLTVEMIRSLSTGLGIPAEILVQDSVSTVPTEELTEWGRFPTAEMRSRGWIEIPKGKTEKEKILGAVKKFIEDSIGQSQSPVFAKRTISGEAYSPSFFYALTAWQARVLHKAKDSKCCALSNFEYKNFSDDFIRELVKLSSIQDDPAHAIQTLREVGIGVVIEEHLSKTKLDGAAMLAPGGQPVIGLTLRFDRIDNFWFTLIHECMHIKLHLTNPNDVIFDRLVDKESDAEIEIEANLAAQEFLIPRAHWRSANVRLNPNKKGINEFASELGVHPAIVAGRIQKESERFSSFTDMVGHGEIRSSLLDRFK